MEYQGAQSISQFVINSIFKRGIGSVRPITGQCAKCCYILKKFRHVHFCNGFVVLYGMGVVKMKAILEMIGVGRKKG